MKIELTEKQLIEMYINGNNESVAIIYKKYWKLFLSVSKKYICNNEDAEDLVHSVIEKLLTTPLDKRIKQFCNINSVPSFFYTIIRNASLDYLRKKKINTINLEQAEEPINIENELIQSLEYSKVGLSKSEIICFEEYLNGNKPQAISIKLNKNLSTVKNTLHNAKQKIIKHYKANNNFTRLY
jgi:RNA polymerase sigma factor, sigma-70 family